MLKKCDLVVVRDGEKITYNFFAAPKVKQCKLLNNATKEAGRSGTDKKTGVTKA